MTLKQALYHGLVLKKLNRVIKLSQENCLKSYIDINKELRENAKKHFWNKKLKLMNNAVFGTTMENVRKQRHHACNNQSKKKLFRVRTKLVHKKFFSKNVLAIEMKKTKSIVYDIIILLYY